MPSFDRSILRIVRSASLLAALSMAGCSEDTPPPPPAKLACQSGAWQFDDGEIASLSRSDHGLRYRFIDGRSGRFEATDADELTAMEGWRKQGPIVARVTFEPCAKGRMRFRLQGGPDGIATKIPLQIEDTRFRSGTLMLQGRLVMPAATTGPVPLAVLVHGSEHDSAVDANPMQYLLPAQGVAAFVFDKRGTGRSEGEYTQDFDLLAGDAIAALAQARRLRPDAFSHVGYVGGSQGGWIAPLAASRSRVDYAVALFGLADGPLAEDREQVMDGLRSKGHKADVLAKAHEVTDVTGQLVASGFTEGFDELDRVRSRYGDEPWFADLEGEFTGSIAHAPSSTPQWLMRAMGKREDPGTSWGYEPLPVLDKLRVPQLWVLAEDDTEAPNAETRRRLQKLQGKGRPVDVVVFPRTDHGIVEYAQEGSERVRLRHPDGYLRLLADWIRLRRLEGSYGSGKLQPATARSATTQAQDPSSVGPPSR
jgi:pimeloyl-ACP methyl ester carboxylesterase